MPDYLFKLDFKVRDYECDIQGIVNNSVYQNYLEHTRHEYLSSIGIDFAELAKENINLIAIRVELDYKYPLRSGDAFWVGLKMERISRIRFAFAQNIYKYPDHRLILNGRTIATAMNEQGRPLLPKQIVDLFSRDQE